MDIYNTQKRRKRKKKLQKIVFGKNEIHLYERLGRFINTGVIYTEKKGVCIYSITNVDAVINVINHINGKYCTPNIQDLYKTMYNFNKWRNANIVKLPLETSSLDYNF